MPQAGWLQVDNQGNAYITPCEYARVEHDDLASLSGDDWWLSVPREPLAARKYDRWLQHQNDLVIYFEANSLSYHEHSKGIRLCYKKATNLGNGNKQGTLVFTGQPARRIPNKSGRKHMEFIFYNEKDTKKNIPDKTWRAFREIYSENEDWNNLWKKKDRVPIFYLEEHGTITSLGLSLMYRLPYKIGIYQAIINSNENHQKEPGQDNGYDLADLLFGSINSTDQNAALRGRVSFQTAIVINKTPDLTQAPDTILNAPKPSYYPNYICQRQDPNNPGILRGCSYQTLMNENAKIRGFKRYPARPKKMVGVQALNPDQQDNYDVQIRLWLLPSGTTFEGRILFHNLRPQELGALLWAMSWGNDDGLRHSLGMGKPFGFGQIHFKILSKKSWMIPTTSPGKTLNLNKEKRKELINTFEMYMEQSSNNKGGWKDSPQIRNLLAMADPEAANQLPPQMKLRHMCLNPDQHINEFQWAKQPPKNSDRPCYFLADYADATGWPGEATQKRWQAARSTEVADEVKSNSDLHPWLREALLNVISNSQATDLAALMRHKNLFKTWNNIEDPALKKEVFEHIRHFWNTRGWWKNPSNKTTREIKQKYEKEAARL